MTKWLRAHLTFSNVISVIALVVALGGGYALAVSGSGNLQTGARTGFPDDSGVFTTVRKLTGIGKIQASCSSGALKLRFHNSSGEVLVEDEVITSKDGFAGANSTPLGNGSNKDDGFFGPPSGGGRWLYHLYLYPSSDGKSPQADIEMSAYVTGDCEEARVTVFSLNAL